MRKRRRELSLVLALVLCMGMLALPVGAASDEAVNAAEELYARGLFKGTGTDSDGLPIFDLDRTPTRNEAVTMLVACSGKNPRRSPEHGRCRSRMLQTGQSLM